MPSPESPIHRYHDGTKHYFNRFARALGYLDWASQPKPFRSYSGARIARLYPAPGVAASHTPPAVTFAQLLDRPLPPQPLTFGALGDVLRHSLGLSAWKRYGSSRWSLRVNPSSGNLHPTEAYVVCGAMEGLSDRAGVYHYAADTHALERRCAFDTEGWTSSTAGDDAVWLVVVTSIHWREAWKYGERAFRYCQHDTGHAVAAVSLAAATYGWRTEILATWPHGRVAGLVGIDRAEDFVEAEPEEPACVIAVTARQVPEALARGGAELLDAVRAGEWTGRASQLSEDHVTWSFIDDAARTTEDPGHAVSIASAGSQADTGTGSSVGTGTSLAHADQSFRALALQRRSAVSFDGLSTLPADAFFAILRHALPGPLAPWSTMWWPPRIHLALFVHRVDGVAPGVFVLLRDKESGARLAQAIPHPLERAHETLPLMLLARGDCRGMARRLSCDQDIASDGFFSLGMLADFDGSLDEHGPSFYRHLFWESGVVGQMLYLAAEAAGVRGTGIGCFYDDPVHEALGLKDHAFQSLYHFTIGVPVEDTRLSTDSGYEWEAPGPRAL